MYVAAFAIRVAAEPSTIEAAAAAAAAMRRDALRCCIDMFPEPDEKMGSEWRRRGYRLRAASQREVTEFPLFLKGRAEVPWRATPATPAPRRSVRGQQTAGPPNGVYRNNPDRVALYQNIGVLLITHGLPINCLLAPHPAR